MLKVLSLTRILGGERLTGILADDLAGEAGLSHLAVDLQPALLGEDGAEVSEEALHALLTLFG